MSRIINYLITESEVVTRKSQTEPLPNWLSDSEVNKVGGGLRSSRNDRTVEVIKLLYGTSNKGKAKESKLAFSLSRTRLLLVSVKSLSSWNSLTCSGDKIHSQSVSSSLIVRSHNFQTKMRWFFNFFLLCFSKPVIAQWALRENNALQLSDN